MSENDAFRTRRTVLQATGVAIAGGSLAGCLDDSASADDDNDPTNDGTLASDDNSTDANDGDAPEETADTIQGTEIEPGTHIDFSGQTTHWEGIAPPSIEDKANPTLILEEGATYTIGWSESDGAAHNMQIRNEQDEVIDDLTTGEFVSEPRADQIIEFTASTEMATYRCEPHGNMERGEIVIVDADGTVLESADDTDDETDDPTDTVRTTFELEPEADIRFSGQTVSWEGVAPSVLEGVENPTLVLQEGEQYSIGWTEGDGMPHNLQIRNDSNEVVDDLATEVVAEPGKDQILEFTASSEMTQYVCHPHETTMVGSIRVE